MKVNEMSRGSGRLTPLQRVGLTVFVLGIIFTVVFIGYGILGRPLPDWVLALTTVL